MLGAMETRAILAAALLAGCADPWAGVYDGVTTTEARDCDTGEQLAPDVRDGTVRVERDDRGLFISGRCLLRLDELSDASATVVPTECDTTLEDGTPVHYEIVNGRAERSGDQLALMWATDLTSPGVCLFGSSTFEGSRR